MIEMKLEDEIQQRQFRNEQQKAALNLLLTSSWLTNEHKAFFKQFGLTAQQYNVLRILRGQLPHSISTSEIKFRMLDKNSDTSRIVDRLAIKKLINKKSCKKDRRLVDVIISEEGLKLLNTMDQTISGLDQLVNLTETDAGNLNVLLDKMRGA